MVTAAISLAFCAFLRYDYMSKLYADWIQLGPAHLEIFLESRKNDQYREGHWIAVAAIPGCCACPVTLVRSLIFKAGLESKGHVPLFSAVMKGAYGEAPISYSKMRALMRQSFASIGLDTKQFGTHSCRAGGATLAANRGVPDRAWMEHGGWKSVKAASGYIKTSLDIKLSVTHSMFMIAPSLSL